MLKYLLVSMRPTQWTKNLFVFAGLIFAEMLFFASELGKAVLAFILFCLVSSAVYLINDLVDTEQDRQHPTKRDRPLPSGRLKASWAASAAAVLLAISLPLAFWTLGRQFGLVILSYLVIMLVYCFLLRKVVIIDVLTIAAGFDLRVLAGTVAVSVPRFSPWLYVCMTLLALFLGFSKRRHELSLLNEGAPQHRQILQEYTLRLLDQMIVVAMSTTIIAYCLYTFSAENLPENHTMMLTIPFVIYGILRYLYLVHVKGEGGEPENVVLKDPPMMIDIGLWVIACVAILYLS